MEKRHPNTGFGAQTVFIGTKATEQRFTILREIENKLQTNNQTKLTTNFPGKKYWLSRNGSTETGKTLERS